MIQIDLVICRKAQAEFYIIGWCWSLWTNQTFSVL